MSRTPLVTNQQLHKSSVENLHSPGASPKTFKDHSLKHQQDGQPVVLFQTCVTLHSRARASPLKRTLAATETRGNADITRSGIPVSFTPTARQATPEEASGPNHRGSSGGLVWRTVPGYGGVLKRPSHGSTDRGHNNGDSGEQR